MGYTHYWYRKKELDGADLRPAAADCAQMAVAAEIPLERVYPGEPAEFGPEQILFNGRGEEGHEDFFLPHSLAKGPGGYIGRDERGRIFDYCKTARKPYDLTVCCCLIVLKHWLGEDISIKSDGDDAEANGSRARSLCQRVLGYGGDFSLLSSK